jgi:hypothetical protein
VSARKQPGRCTHHRSVWRATCLCGWWGMREYRRVYAPCPRAWRDEPGHEIVSVAFVRLPPREEVG